MKIPAFLILVLLIGQVLFGQSIKDNNYTVIFSPESARLTVKKADGTALIEAARFAYSSAGKTIQVNPNNYHFSVEIRNMADPEMIISGKDKKGIIDLTYYIQLSPADSAITLELRIKNVSENSISLQSIEPLRIINSEDGILHFESAAKCITNGAMYYDAGSVHDMNKPWVKPEPYGETKGGKNIDTILNDNPLTIHSWWNISIFGSDEDNAFTTGYLLNGSSLGRIRLLKHNQNQLSLLAESVLNPGFMLAPRQEISSDVLAIFGKQSLFNASRSYGKMMKNEMNEPSCSTVNGWCNWFYTMDLFTENEILENAAFAAKHLRPYGLEYIQIDEGFQTAHGDWQGNERFPHGLKWLCDSIKSMGLKPGIWISPFVISEDSKVFQAHPEWLLKDSNDQLIRIGPWPSENTDWYKNEKPKRYCLDITHPEAEKWYAALIDTIVSNWGFEMIKLDFVAWTVFSANHFYERGASPAMVYRRALQIMREKAGQNCHILDCGPGHVSGGFINSMRIEYDQNYGSAENTWTQYFKGSSCSAGAQGKRWFFHNNAWTNDIDHVCMDILSENEAQAVATLIGLSGGNTMSGDRLPNLDPVKIEILKKIFPSTPEYAVPADLKENDPQTIFYCKVERDYDNWTLGAFFNPDRKWPIKKKVTAKNLHLNPLKSYLAFNFWKQHFQGEFNDTLIVDIPEGSVTLLSIHEKTGHPQVLGTNRHVKQGAVEIESASFDVTSNIFSAISSGPSTSQHSVFVYVPENYFWQPDGGRIYELHEGYTIRQYSENVVRVDLNFGKAQKINWQISFRLKPSN